MITNQEKAASIINSAFYEYRKDIINVWRDYNFIQFLVQRYRTDVSKDSTLVLSIENHNDSGIKHFSAKDIHGICTRLHESTNSKKALIDSVALSEYYLQNMAATVYKAFPDKLNSRESIESIGQQIKLMQVIFDSEDKAEMLDKLIEEKIRGIFYGNPIDFFEKDKARLGFGTVFKEKYCTALAQYGEIINRRNIYIHNQGMVDRKYLRETGIQLKMGTKPKITKEYLKHSILLLLGISAASTKIVLEETLKVHKYHKFVASSYNRFDKDYKIISK